MWVKFYGVRQAELASSQFSQVAPGGPDRTAPDPDREPRSVSDQA